METSQTSTRDRLIFIAQIASILLIWLFVILISIWIVNLLLLAIELNDVPGASVGISIVAIPVFLTLACILTYVFVGLQREKRRLNTKP
jgi:hypothetical protein